MAASAGDAGYGAYGGDNFIERAGAVAQRRHTRKGPFFDPVAAHEPMPGTPTSPKAFGNADFPLTSTHHSGSPRKVSNSSNDSSHDGYADNGSPGSPRIGAFPTRALPPPHLPLRKSSASDLRSKASDTNGNEYYDEDAPSPTRSTARPSDTQTGSPRLRGDRQLRVSPNTTALRENLQFREGEAYAPPSVLWGRARGLTSTSQMAPTPPGIAQLKATSSIPDLAAFRSSGRAMQSSTYRPDRGPNSRDTSMSFRNPPPVPWKDTDEVRSSFRSALTNGSYMTYASSGYVDASETERSSVLTRASSLSDLFYKGKAQGEDEGMSVEDAIALYADGFTDDELEKKLDQGIEDIQSFMPPPAENNDPQEPLPDMPQDDLPEKQVRSLEEPLNITTRYDSKFSSEIVVPKSPSAPHLPLSPLKAHPVRSDSPPMPPKDEYEDAPEDASPVSSNTSSPQRSIKIEHFEPIPRDRYGFKKASQHITVGQYDAWNIHYTEYLDRRRKKWVAMMKQWGLAVEKPIRFPPKSDKVKRYIRKGIPPDWRGAAWFWYAGGPSRLAQNPGLYQKLVAEAENGYLSETDRESIERDLNRTFPDNIKFKPDPAPEPTKDFPGRDVRPPRSSSRGELPIIKALRRVLQSFAIANPSIGYCQSLNFLAGLLLLFLDEDEEKAFHLLNIITTTHLPGTHAKVLEANVDVGVLMTCIKESMPAVWARIDDMDDGRGQISTSRLPTVSLATTAWFMSCFIGNLPIETVLRVWDSFFYEGSKTLFRIALAIFKSGEWEIRNFSDHMEIFQVVQQIPRKLIDANSLMEACYKRRNGFGHLSQETIDARRKERRTALQRDRDRKNGQLNPHEGDELRPPSRSGLRRAASKAIRGHSRRRGPLIQEAT